MVKYLNILKHQFDFHTENFYGRLNLVGTAIFYMVAVLIIFFEKNIIEPEILQVLIYSLFLSIGTANLKNVIFPYKNRKPFLIYINKKLMFKHLLLVIVYGYVPQLLCFSILVFFVGIYGYYSLIPIMILSLALLFLSKVLPDFFFIISKFFILGTGLGIYLNKHYVSYLSLLLSLLFILVITSNVKNKIIPSHIFPKSYSTNRKTILSITKAFFVNFKYLNIVILLVLSFSGYLFQLFVNNIYKLPILLLIYTIFITIMEIFVGSTENELEIDKARIQLLSVNNQITIYQRFLSSSYFFYSLILLIISLEMLPGIVLSTKTTPTLFSNIILLLFPFFIGFVYFKKATAILEKNNTKIFKLTLPLLYLLLTMVVVFIGE